MKFTEEPRDFAPHLPASRSCPNFFLSPIFANFFFFFSPFPKLNNICRIIEKSTLSRDKCSNVPVYSWSAHDKLSIAPGTINLRETLGHQREQRKICKKREIWNLRKFKKFTVSALTNSTSERGKLFLRRSSAGVSSSISRGPRFVLVPSIFRNDTASMKIQLRAPWNEKFFLKSKNFFGPRASRPSSPLDFFHLKGRKKNLIHRYRR